MCGINGFNWKDSAILKEMNIALSHRGPDDDGEYIDELISLGHRRLSILDLSKNGHQPMSYDDGNIIIVFNGEIYNYLEIKEDLLNKGHSFSSTSDTEVILCAYKEWSVDCVNRFNGMWSFCIYDKTKQILFLSRDRFGLKPLYYYYNENKFVFSSEIKGLLCHKDIEKIKNDKLIYEFLIAGMVSYDQETFFKNIFLLRPGHNMIYYLKSNKLQTSKYYSIPRTNYEDSDENFGALKTLLKNSVNLRMRSDVEVGILLSGGLDSTTIAYLLKDLGKSKNMNAFCYDFDNKEFDESKIQNETIKNTQIKSHVIKSNEKKIFSIIRDVVYSQESPIPTSSICGIFILMKDIHKNSVKVVLDGTAADEVFAGYPVYNSYVLFEQLRSLRLINFVTELIEIRRNNKQNFGMIIKSLCMILMPKKMLASVWSRIFRNTLNKEFKRQVDWEKVLTLYKKQGLRDAQEEIFYLSMTQLLKWVDKNSMAFGIEVRCPFLDYNVVNFGINLRKNVTRGIGKNNIRCSMRNIVPEKVLNNYEKKAFAAPDDLLFKNKEVFLSTKEIFSSEKFRGRKYWNHKSILGLLNEHFNSEKLHGSLLFKVLTLEIFLREYFDK